MEDKKTNPQANPLECCLFFNANSFSRIITKTEEEEFAAIGMTPCYAFIVTLVIHSPHITQKRCKKMNMTPSTVSRFIDALEKRELLQKSIEGCNTLISPTAKATE